MNMQCRLMCLLGLLCSALAGCPESVDTPGGGGEGGGNEGGAPPSEDCVLDASSLDSCRLQ